MHLVIFIGYHRKDSFCHNGIVKTISETCKTYEKVKCTVVDLYDDEFHAAFHAEKNKELLIHYKKLITDATHLVFVSPVWWFRCTSMLEGFFDQIFAPGFAYDFRKITKTYGMPVPLLKHKRVLTYLTHGAPAFPVYTLYLNSVWGRLQLGVFSFVFGWFRPKFRQFFSVPFCSDKRRASYLKTVKKDIEKEVERYFEYDWFT